MKVNVQSARWTGSVELNLYLVLRVGPVLDGLGSAFGVSLTGHQNRTQRDRND